MHLTYTDLAQISQEIWAAIVGIELRPTIGEQAHAEGARVVTGAVQITGDWSGATTIQVSEDHARQLAATMFMMDLDEVTEEEMTDTVGELANMAGGNVKSTLEGSCQLSLPAVTVGRDYRVSVPGSGIKERIALEADGELVVVTLFERRSDAG